MAAERVPSRVAYYEVLTRTAAEDDANMEMLVFSPVLKKQQERSFIPHASRFAQDTKRHELLVLSV
ncbi:MAG: hypothetical protein QM296_04545 [Bacillota bacterium]|nr:hypothetical protein [Bacillota bacterium]